MRRCREFPVQYVFSQKIPCALPVVLLRPLITITHAIFGLDGRLVIYSRTGPGNFQPCQEALPDGIQGPTGLFGVPNDMQLWNEMPDFIGK